MAHLKRYYRVSFGPFSVRVSGPAESSRARCSGLGVDRELIEAVMASVKTLLTSCGDRLPAAMLFTDYIEGTHVTRVEL